MNFQFLYLKKFLNQAFELREGEVRKTVLLQLNIFLIINALLIIKPTVNSLFLVRFGAESLPQAYLMVAVFAVALSNAYTKLVSRRQLLPILIWTYASSVLVLIGLGTLFALNVLEGWILWFFYLWVAMFALITTSQFWIFCNMVFDLRQAKRLFGFIGSGAIAGGIVGGYMTTALAALIGTEKLPFVAALLLLACIPITRHVWRRELSETKMHPPLTSVEKTEARHPFRIILQSRHLALLTAIVGLGVLVAKLVDFQYSAIAAAVYQDPDELTAFFGFWFSTMNIVSLLIQLFITRHIVGIFGAGTSLIFLPLGILGGALASIFSPQLWSSLFMKVSDGSLKQSVHKAAIELMALPIPADIRNRTKSFIDVTVDSIATGVTGLLLIFVIRGLNLHINVVLGIIVVVVGLWLWLVLQMRRTYLKTFREKITQPGLEEEFNLSNESVLGGLEQVLKGGTERQIMYVLRRTRELKEVRLLESFRNLLDHPSANVRRETLLNLYYLKDPEVLEKARQLVSDVDPIVRTRALEYVFAHSQEAQIPVFFQYLDSSDPAVRRAAVTGLARETRNNPQQQKTYKLESHMRALQAAYEAETQPLERAEMRSSFFDAIGYGNLHGWYPVLEEALRSGDTDCMRDAVLALGKTRSPAFLPLLLEKITHPALESTVLHTIVAYGPGYVDWLGNRLAQGQIPLPILRKVPLLLAETGTQDSVELLLNLFDQQDRSVRHNALRALNKLRIQFPYLKFKRKEIMDRIMREADRYRGKLAVLYAQNKNLLASSEVGEDKKIKLLEARNHLIRILEHNLDRNLERIFRLLGLRYSPEDIYPIYLSLQSNVPEQRNNALEFLDNLLEPGLKRVLMPIAESALPEFISQDAFSKLSLPIKDEFQSIELLLKTEDNRIKLAVIYLISQLDDPRFVDLLVRLKEESNETVSRTASEALESHPKTRLNG